MFFTKKTGFHCLMISVMNDNPSPQLIIMPNEVAADVISTIRKFEKSALNDEKYIGNKGPFTIVHDIQDFQKISIYNDAIPWSEPILYTDYAKVISDRLQDLMDDVEEKVEEDLVFFVGEFTMMQDNGFSAPF